MAQDKALTEKKLTEMWKDASTGSLDIPGKKYVLMSDLHFGDGGSADDFNDNEPALIAALEHYHQNGFELVLLGDIEEFWQFELPKINSRYSDTVYKRIRAFGDDKVHRIFGNHDIDWATSCDPAKNTPLESLCAVEALKLRDGNGREVALLVHGHQGSVESDKNSWISRAGVRVFAKVESVAKFFGLYGHKSATKSMIATDYERIMYEWAKSNKVMLFCGHSHRAMFAAKSHYEALRQRAGELQTKLLQGGLDEKEEKSIRKELQDVFSDIWEEERKGRTMEPTEGAGTPKPCYFNTGCGLYSDGLTAIEIYDDNLRLVRWSRDMTAASRPTIFEQGKLSELIAKATA